MNWGCKVTVSIAFALALPAGMAGCGGDTILASGDGTADSALEVDGGGGDGAEQDVGDEDGLPDGTDGSASDEGTPYEPWRPRPISCEELVHGYGPLDILVDADRVCVLSSWMAPPVPERSSYLLYQEIDSNDGSGWTAGVDWIAGGSMDGAPSLERLAGTLNGHLVAWDTGPETGEWLGLLYEVLPPRMPTVPADTTRVTAAWFVGPELAWLLPQTAEGEETTLLRWDGRAWLPFGPVVPPHTGARLLWGDESTVIVLGGLGSWVQVLRDDEWEESVPVPGTGWTAVWGSDPSNVWAATRVDASEDGLYHFDGESWTPVDWPRPSSAHYCAGDPWIKGIWGADGVVFVHTDTTIVRIDGDGATEIANWPGDLAADLRSCGRFSRITRIAGRSATELFVARHWSANGPSCTDDLAILRWDGAEFHPF